MSTVPVQSPPVPKLPDYNIAGINFRKSMPRPKVRGRVIDFHGHLLAARHAPDWFSVLGHFGIDSCVSMSQLEEVVGLQRDYAGRILFIAVPRWSDFSGTDYVDDWLRRIEAFYNLGSRVVKFHMAPGSMDRRHWRLDSPELRPIFREALDRKMGIMTHIGDPNTWYATRYADSARYGTREEHYRIWESVLEEYPGVPWVGAHLGGNPENLAQLQYFLDKFPNLSLNCSATRWIARKISARRDAAREFFIRNQDRIIFGSDQVTGDDRNWDFLASRIWVHRKMWETGYVGPCPILDPDLPRDQQPLMRGLALPDSCLQKLYHDNATRYLQQVGMTFEAWE